MGTAQECYELFWINPGSNTSKKQKVVQSLSFHLKNHLNKTNETCETLLKKQEQIHVTFFYGPLHMDEPILTIQQELIYISADKGCSLEDG